MDGWIKSLVIVLAFIATLFCITDVYGGTTVTCVTTENSPGPGDSTKVCTSVTDAYTTTTDTVSETVTDTGNILTNSTFGSGTSFSFSGWSGTRGSQHSQLNAGTTKGNEPGGSVAATANTTIHQSISVKDDGELTEKEIQNGFKSTLKADVWFWNSQDNTVTLKQIITDNAGNTTTQTRIINDTGCSGTNCGQYATYDDSYIQGSNTATDYTIKVQVDNDEYGLYFQA